MDPGLAFHLYSTKKESGEKRNNLDLASVCNELYMKSYQKVKGRHDSIVSPTH